MLRNFANWWNRSTEVPPLLYTVRVRQLTGELIWEGVVQVFEMDGNPNATEAYAWTCPFDGEDHAVLKSERICGPADAVPATLQASGWGPNFDEMRTGAQDEKMS
jgi:hypothetical protein